MSKPIKVAFVVVGCGGGGVVDDGVVVVVSC